MIRLILLGKLHDGRIHLKIYLDSVLEDLHGYFFLKRRNDQIEKLLLRFLLVLSALGRDVEHSNFSLCVRFQLEVVH